MTNPIELSKLIQTLELDSKSKNSKQISIIASIIEDSIGEIQPNQVITKIKPELENSKGQIFVFIGKNALVYAKAVETIISGKFIHKIWVFQPIGYHDKYENRENYYLELSHPIISIKNIEATEHFLDVGIKKNKFYHFFITGGASSVFGYPEDGISIDQFIELNRVIYEKGLKIEDMNLCRQIIDKAKGGKISSFIGESRVMTWIVSDVVSDDPLVVGSGPSVGSIPVTSECLNTFREISSNVLDPQTIEHLINKHNFRSHIEPYPYEIIVTRKLLVDNVIRKSNRKGIEIKCLDDSVQGDFKDIANEISWFIDSEFSEGIFLMAGEWTVELPNEDIEKGGRLSHMMTFLSLLIQSDCEIIGIATDGKDGNTEMNFYFYAPPIPTSQKEAARVSLKKFNTLSFLEKYGKVGQFNTNINLMDIVLIFKL